MAQVITFEEGWPVLQEGVNKVLHNSPHTLQLTSEEYMQLYTTVYHMCLPGPHYQERCQKMYDQYKKILEDYITSKVLSSLRLENDDNLLKEFSKCWNSYKYITRWLSRFFHYLDRYFIPRKKLLSTEEVSYMIFYELVCDEMQQQVTDGLMSMIDREHRGETIDQALVKNVIDVYLEIGKGSTKYYEVIFEEAIVINTSTFYSEKAAKWIKEEAYSDYMIKVDECLKQERDRAACYFPSSSLTKILEAIKYELLIANEKKLEEKKLLDKEAA